MNVAPKFFEDVRIGEDIPPIRFHVDMTALVKYAGATWDFHRYHYDAAFVQEIGIGTPFADGQMFGALLARTLMSWAGPDGFLRQLSYRQRATVYVDETIVITGRIEDKWIENGTPIASALLSIAKEDGTIVIRDATAKVHLVSRVDQAVEPAKLRAEAK